MKLENKKVFFGENGLTSTSANFIANKAKEMVENEKINTLSFVKTTVKPLDSSEETVINTGSNYEVDFVKNLEHIGMLHSLEAWLREGIKAKQELTNKVNNCSESEYEKLSGNKMPVYPRREEISDDDFMSMVSEHDLVEHYKAQSLASVIGKFIHPGGVYDVARAALKKYLAKPTELAQGTGRDYLYVHTSVCNPQSVEDVYFTLQDMHREEQAKVNKLMYDKEEWERNKNREYSDIYKDKVNEYNEELTKFYEDFRQWKSDELKKIQDLKIVIPKSLKKIYDEVNKK